MTDRRHRNVDEWVPEPGSPAVAQGGTTPDQQPPECTWTLRNARVGFTVVTLATERGVDLRLETNVQEWGSYRRRPGFVSIKPTGRFPYSVRECFDHQGDRTAPWAEAYIGPITWRAPAATLLIQSGLDRLATLDEYAALAAAAGRYYGRRFRLAKVKLAIDFPNRPYLAENLRAHIYVLRAPRRPLETDAWGTWEWRWHVFGSQRPILGLRVSAPRGAGRRVVRLTVTCGCGVLKQLNAASVADLRAVPWRTWFFERLRFVSMRTDGIADTLAASFRKLAAARGVSEALTHFSTADRRLVRSRLVELPGLTGAAADALGRLEAQLRGSARPLPRPEG
jgi:hypothetical protein